MKKIFMLLLFLLSAIAIADIGPVGRSTSIDLLGNVQSGSQEKWFIYVKNSSGGNIADGAVVILDEADDDGFGVTTTTTAGKVPICVMSKTDGSVCADGKLCRCQTYGLHTGVIFDSTNDAASAGDNVYLSENNAGYVQSEALGSIAASDNPIGVIYDDASASADVEVYIRLR